MRIGIVGHGVVGSALSRFFSSHEAHEVVIYDKFNPAYRDSKQRRFVANADLVFVCVPTPLGSDGMSCDTSAVEECIDWIRSPVCIRSTVVPGTVDRLTRGSSRLIGFSPEYLGEQPMHPWREEADCGFLIVGGSPELTELVISAYSSTQNFGIQYYRTTARTAELCKYMENCFLAAKVAFVNQFHEIAIAFDVDFNDLRKLWLVDPRIGLSHTLVSKRRGFRGRCLPKDLAAIIAAMETRGGAPLLEAIYLYNQTVCLQSDRLVEDLATRSGDGICVGQMPGQQCTVPATTLPVLRPDSDVVRKNCVSGRCELRLR